MKSMVLGCVVVMLLSACASDSGIVQTGTDSYMITKQQATGFPGMGNLKSDAMREAYAQCSSSGKSVQVIDDQETKPPYILGNYPRIELTFRCSSGPAVAAVRTYSANMYNLSTGEVVSGTIRTDHERHSILTAGPTKSGETFTGEATAIDSSVRSSTIGVATVSTPGIFSDTYVRTSSFATKTPGFLNGRAILVGTQGTVVDILFRFSDATGSGDGEGKDNKGVSYSIQFTQQR